MARLRRRSARLYGANDRLRSLLPPLGRFSDDLSARVVIGRLPESVPLPPVDLFEELPREVRRQDFGVRRFSVRVRPRHPVNVVYPSPVLQVVVPSKERFCLRRKMRREVLFAFRKTGRGSGRGRRRWNMSSNWRC